MTGSDAFALLYSLLLIAAAWPVSAVIVRLANPRPLHPGDFATMPTEGDPSVRSS